MLFIWNKRPTATFMTQMDISWGAIIQVKQYKNTLKGHQCQPIDILFVGFPI